jgi:hypothetical protein
MIKRNLNNIRPPSHHYKRFCKEFYTQKTKANKTVNGQEILNHRRRKNKYSEKNKHIRCTHSIP